MNGSENNYAVALFFALVSLGAILKIDNLMIGVGVGAVAALLAAINFRQALNKSAQAAEEDHQRMEIQFQQLRSKMIDTSNTNISAMSSLNEVTRVLNGTLQVFQENSQLLKENSQLLQESLKIMNDKQIELDNFTQLLKIADSIHTSIADLKENSAPALIAGLEKNSVALNDGLEKIFVAIKSLDKPPDPTGELQNLIAVEKTNVANIQSALKILNNIAQTQKGTSYTKELEKINSTIEKNNAAFAETNSAIENLGAKLENLDALNTSVAATLGELKDSSGAMTKSVAETLVELKDSLDALTNSFADTFSEMRVILDSLNGSLADTCNEMKNSFDTLKISTDDSQKELSELVKISGELSKGFTTTLDDLRLDMAKLSARLEALKTSPRKTRRNNRE